MGQYISQGAAGLGIDDLNYIDQGYRRDPNGMWSRLSGLGAVPGVRLPAVTSSRDPVVQGFWEWARSGAGRPSHRYTRALKWVARHKTSAGTWAILALERAGFQPGMARAMYVSVLLSRHSSTLGLLARIIKDPGVSLMERRNAKKAYLIIRRMSREFDRIS